ncbi:MAG: NAD kinase [Bacteroidetes bacterium]|nr:NAD kinase [Bacteroidota bacterium]MCK4287669.1 NAD kinase [Bacteroidales bacterium]MCK4360182.1 NAD kinase [Bacteroidales bacterium]
MNIALFGKKSTEAILPYIQQLINKLESVGSKIFIYEPFLHSIKPFISFNTDISVFNTHKELKNNVDFLFSIGGDGTLLNTVILVRDSGIPILGINLGRLGFLSSVSKDEIIPAIDNIIKGNYTLDQRALLKLKTPDNLFGDINYALNELTINRKDSTSLIVINVYIDNQILNSYWADGVIVATPTGSTAYSLSCGGPIITPGSENFVITPIATHNLTVRPFVISDNNIIKINVEGKNEQFLVSLDSRTVTIDSSIELVIEKEDFKINLVQMPNKNFFTTIRDKLKWGLDFRN